MTLWQNGASGLYTLTIAKYSYDPKSHEFVDLFSCGKSLYELIDNAKLYYHNREAKFFEEANDKEAEAEIKKHWNEYHSRGANNG